jgi:hypothetical protein
MEIKEYIEGRLKKNIVTSKVLLDRMRMIEEDSRQSFAYNDSHYISFYYWLGEIFKAKALVEIGFQLGLLSGNYLKTCKTVQYFLALQETRKGEYYSHRLGKSNVRDNYRRSLYIHVGKCEDDIFQTKLKALEVDLVIINEEVGYDRHRLYYDAVWPQMAKNGIIVVEYLKKYKPSLMAFKDFCLSKNINPIYINTTYGVGVIEKN